MSHPVFPLLIRLWLCERPVYAQLLANLPRREEADLRVPLLIRWEARSPLLSYNGILLEKLAQEEAPLLDWTEEALLHLLLQHHRQVAISRVSWSANLAADMEVDQYRRNPNPEWTLLWQRLHLPAYSEFTAIENALLRLARSDRDAPPPSYYCSMRSGSCHRYWWQVEVPTALAWQGWWRNEVQYLRAELPGPLAQRLQNLAYTVPAQQPWRLLLRRFLANGSRRLLRHTVRRPSRRYGIVPGNRRQRQLRLAVAIDTSGSISAYQRQQFFAELQQLRHFTTQITIIEADDRVRKVYSFTGVQPVVSLGGGATHFDPVLHYLNANDRFDALVYLTDGKGASPEVQVRVPVLWLVMESGHLASAK